MSGSANPYDSVMDSVDAPSPSPAAPVPAQPTSAPAPAASANPYDAVVGAVDGDASQRAQAATISAAQSGTPDQAAQARQLAPQVGAPASVVAQDLPTWQQRADLQRSRATLAADPVLSSWLAANPDTVPVARDDYGTLSALGSSLSALKTGFSEAMTSADQARARAAGDMSTVTADAATLQRLTAPGATPGVPAYLAGLVGKFAGSMASTAEHVAEPALAGAAVGGAAGAAFGGVGAIPGALAGAGVGALTGLVVDGFRQGYGGLKLATDTMRDDQGRPIDPQAAEGMAIVGGLASAALNVVGFRGGAAPIVEAAKPMLAEAATQAAARPGVADALKSIAGGIVKGGATGAAFGAAGGAAQVATEQGARLLSNLGGNTDFASVLNDPGQRAAAVQTIAQSMAEMALTFGGLHAAAPIGALARPVLDTLNIGRASTDATAFDVAQQTAAASKLRGRDADAFQDFAAQHTDGTPTENVYVPADRVQELYQTAGVAPGADDGVLGRAAPDIADQLEQAQATGGDVVVPTSAWLAHVAGTDTAAALHDDIRLRADGLSLRDAADANDRIAAAVQARGEEADAAFQAGKPALAGADAVRADVVQQARAAGFTPDVAEQYGGLFAARYGARGDRLGVDPMDLYRNEGVQFRAADLEEQGPGRTFAQPALDYGADGEPEDGAHTADAARTLEQGDADGKRGSIQLSDGKAVISLFRQRDLSTVLHESGHLFLDEMRRDAADPRAPQQLRDDHAAILKHLGVESADQIGVAQHETFARSFEAYLMEGRAPSRALARTFARFRAWLTGIYRNIKGLGVELSPEMRDVFDRMLATDDELQAVRREQALDPIFTDAQSAGMTDAGFGAYRAAVDGARDKASSDMLAKAMRAVRQRREQWYRDESEPLRAAATEAVDARPEIRALDLVRRGYEVDGERRSLAMDTDAVREIVGDEGLASLPPSVPPLTKRGGVHPDELAEMVGVRSGDKLLTSLISHEQRRRQMRAVGDTRSVRRADIENAVTSQMAERHGDVMSDGSIEEEALRSLHSERQGEVLAAEVHALSRSPGLTTVRGQRVLLGDPTPLERIREFARAAIGRKNIRDATDTRTLARNESNAGRAAFDALNAGDRAEAVRQKQRQLVAHEMLRESENASEFVDKALRTFGKYADKDTVSGMDQGYLDQIHGLLERFDFRNQSEAAVQRLEGIRQFVEASRGRGEEPQVPDKLLDESFRQHYTRMSVDDLRGLHDAVESLSHLGRMKATLLDRAERRAHEDVVVEAVETAGKLKQRVPLGVKSMSALRDRVGSAVHAVRTADAALLKIEQMVQWLDGGDSSGVFNRMVFRRLSDAQHAANDLRAEYVSKMRALAERFPEASRKAMRQRMTVHELTDQRTGKPFVMERQELLAVALNLGNDGNKTKLLQGYGWSEEAVHAALNRVLTKADWDHVQSTWDLVHELWPRISEMEKRLSGVAPEKVEAAKVVTPYGEYRGGYYPVKYDPVRTPPRPEDPDAMFRQNYTRATTGHGHVEERTGYVAPLHLSLDILPSHLGQVIHDITHRETVMEVDRFLSDPRVAAAMRSALGDEYQSQFRPWLRDIANEKAVSAREMTGWDNLIRRARINATVVGIGFRMSTMLKHGSTAAGNSVGEVGAKPFAAALTAFAKDPAGVRDMVMSKSGEMRHRMNEIDRDLHDVMDKGMTGETSLTDGVRRFSMMGVAMLDMASALPTWLARYQTALAEGMEDGDAVYAADQSVRNAHGAGSMKDRSAIQRGSEAWKLATMFYSFFNHLYNRQRTLARQALDVRSASDLAPVLARSFFTVLWPAMVEATVSGGGPSEGESWFGWGAEAIGSTLAGGIPVVRDIVSSVERGMAYQVTPVADIVRTARSAGSDIMKVMNGEDAPHAVKDVGNTVGYATGLPTGQAAGAAQFMDDVLDGREDPEGAADWMRGLMYGPAPVKR